MKLSIYSIMIILCIFSILCIFQEIEGNPQWNLKKAFEDIGWHRRPTRGDRIWKRSASVPTGLKSIPIFTDEQFRTEVIVPVMNIMGLGLSVFGNLYPVRQLRNDDGTPMNATDLKLFRTQMNQFHSRFSDLGQHLTGVLEHSRALREPFQILGKKISLGRQLLMQERKLKQAFGSQ